MKALVGKAALVSCLFTTASFADDRNDRAEVYYAQLAKRSQPLTVIDVKDWQVHLPLTDDPELGLQFIAVTEDGREKLCDLPRPISRMQVDDRSPRSFVQHSEYAMMYSPKRWRVHDGVELALREMTERVGLTQVMEAELKKWALDMTELDLVLDCARTKMILEDEFKRLTDQEQLKAVFRLCLQLQSPIDGGYCYVERRGRDAVLLRSYDKSLMRSESVAIVVYRNAEFRGGFTVWNPKATEGGSEAFASVVRSIVDYAFRADELKHPALADP